MHGAAVAEEVLTAWALHRGTRCRGIHWDKWEERGVEHLAELAGCLGGAAVAAVCEAFCEDYAGWRGGMPDLVVWQRRELPPEEEPLAGASGGTGTFYPYGEARLVEVKSPNDKLSEQQRAWIERLSARGVLVEVCSLHADCPPHCMLVEVCSLHADCPPHCMLSPSPPSH
jgi:fanconi-associated nuclease 1